MPGLLASALSLVSASLPSATSGRESLPPRRLAIYYGYPSLINGAYDIIVFGDGLEFVDQDANRTPPGAGRDEHDRTVRLITRLKRTGRQAEVFGYVTIGNSQRLSLSEVQRRVQLWASMGVTGILLDEAGQDYGVTAQRLVDAVNTVHAAGLHVCVNAFRLGDLRSVPWQAGDALLLESFGVRMGARQPIAQVIAIADEAAELRTRSGVRLFAVSTASNHTMDADDHSYAWSLAAIWGLDAIGWGEPHYSAVDSRLPWRPRPAEEARLHDAAFLSPIERAPSQVSRRTTRGRIVVFSTGAARFEQTR
jgi:hypothetical protein